MNKHTIVIFAATLAVLSGCKPQAEIHSIDEYKKMPDKELKALSEKTLGMVKEEEKAAKADLEAAMITRNTEKAKEAMNELREIGKKSSNKTELNKIEEAIKERFNKEQSDYLTNTKWPTF